jgi:hypothetical protein
MLQDIYWKADGYAAGQQISYFEEIESSSPYS